MLISPILRLPVEQETKGTFSSSDWVIKDGILIPKSAIPKPRPVGIDLFAGCGGFSLGSMQSGIQILAGVDNDVIAAITYTHNLGAYPMRFVFLEPDDKARMEKELRKQMKVDDKKKTISHAFTTGGGWIRGHPDMPGVGVFIVGDVRKLTGKRILEEVGKKVGEIDVVMGSPPCQGFSMAGKRNVMDPRNSLVFEFARLVLEIQPRTIIFENVPGIINMLTPEGLPVLDVFVQMLEKGNFGDADMLKRTLLTSAGCGAMVKGRKRSDMRTAIKEENVPDDLIQEQMF
jgi:DNA (cytosine-5)-methyltransferase 1